VVDLVTRRPRPLRFWSALSRRWRSRL
jgi:hypothetical protein